MAHFAKLDENNIVLLVCTVNNNVILDEQGIERESKGIDFLTGWSGGHRNWKQTSYNCSFRKNYAGIGDRYDPVLDAFISPSPYPSWNLNTQTCRYEPPVPFPSIHENKRWGWDENIQNWIEIP